MDPINRIVALARSQVGYQEGRSKNGSWNNRIKYAAQVPGLEWADGQPWCATFMSWLALKADVAPLFPRTASCDVGAKWFKDRNRWSETPKVGDQVFFGKPSDLSHTGLVIGVDAEYITTVEGNTNDSGSREGDGVYVKRRRRRDPWVVGYGHPAYPAVRPAKPPKAGGKPLTGVQATAAKRAYAFARQQAAKTRGRTRAVWLRISWQLSHLIKGTKPKGSK